MRTVVLAGLVTALAGPAWSGTDDLFLRTRVTHHREGSVPSESTTYYAGDIVVADGPDDREIEDFRAKTATSVDKHARTYVVTSFEDLARMEDGIGDFIAPKSAAERRLQAELFGAPAPASIRPTGRQERILGYPAREYAVRAGWTRGTVWITDQIPPPKHMAELRRMRSRIAGAGSSGARLNALIQKIPGVELRRTITCVIGKAEVTHTVEVVEVGRRPTPGELLVVPDGFARRASLGPAAQAQLDRTRPPRR